MANFRDSIRSVDSEMISDLALTVFFCEASVDGMFSIQSSWSDIYVQGPLPYRRLFRMLKSIDLSSNVAYIHRPISQPASDLTI